VSGDQIGTKIDFPTANIQVEEDYKLIPCQGVYAVRVVIGKEEYSAMCNIGVRPTINDHGEKRIEVNIFDYQQDLYGQNISLKFISKVRDEKTFANLDELIEQLTKDEIKCRVILGDYTYSNKNKF
jgi:riboflavin kinase/FMN adenylyltransferase